MTYFTNAFTGQKRAALRGSVATAALSLAMLAGPSAFAQSVAAAESAADETIVVTGSLITNPNLDRSSPVTVIGADEVDFQQANVAEDLLREIPGIVPNVGSAVNNGNGGASFVDLRGLGPNRNIVLLDGNRLVPADLTGQFDLNNIPLALVERVDVLTGGASTTYGADAVSGVVNFITRRDFTGLEMNGGYGLTERGDGQTLRLDMTMGANFDEGRGNIVLGIGYQEADQVLQDDRDFSRTSYNSFNGRAEGSGTSVPSRFSGVNPTATNRIANQTDAAGNPLPQICNEATPSAQRPLVPGLPACVSGQAGLRQVTADGTAFRPGNAFDSFNFNPFNIFQTPFKRFNIYAAGRYEVNENLEFYSRAVFSKNKVQTIIAPSGAFGLGNLTVSLNNPFLTTAQRNAFCNFDTDPGVGFTPRFTPAECAAAATARGPATATLPADPNYREVTGVTVARRNVEGGPRISTYDTTFFDYQAGARGAITSTVDYDVAVSYGESDNTETATGYWLNSRIGQGLLVERGPGGAATCQDTSNGCVPLNLFGPVGSITPDMINFLQEASTTTLSTSLTQVRGNISGDAGFGVPFASNPIAFAVGAEWRDYAARQAADTLGQSGDLAGAGGADPAIDGGLQVYELFGELIAPLIQDKPFFEDLTFEAGVRYSSYSVDAPGNPTFDAWTYKLGGSWTVGGGVKVRGGYARAVRAPNISELFSPLNFALTNLSDDPCANLDDAGRALGRPNPTGELLAVCLAQGAPVDSIGAIALPTAGQANTRTTGNVNNRPETSDSYTLGVVFTPQFAPGLTMTLDYYNIYVTNALTSPTSADVIQNCFGPNPLSPPAGAAASSACGVIQRNPETGGLDGTLIGGLFQPTSNQGTLHTDGIDLTANYGTEFGKVGWNIAVTGNWTSRSKFQALPASLNRECVGLYSPDCSGVSGSIQPEWQWSVRNTLTVSDFDFSLLWRYLSKTRFETQDAFRGTLSGGNLNGQEADFNFIPSWHIFDLSARFQANENFTFIFAIQNLFDRQPKVVGNTIGNTSFNSGNVYPSTYDALGRRFNAGVRLNF